MPRRLLQALEDQFGRLAGLCSLDDLGEVYETIYATYSCNLSYCIV